MLLYPYFLRITTPSGVVTWAGNELPPEALSATVERTQNILTRLRGTGVILGAQQPTGTRLKVAAPEEYTLPYSGAAEYLRALRVGDVVQIEENLSNRRALTVWTGAIVVSAPDVPRYAGGQDDADEVYSVRSLEFFHLEEG